MPVLRRDHHGRTYTIRVCPEHGGANVGCCERPTILVETVPVERVRELESARDGLREALVRARTRIAVLEGRS